MNASLRRAAVTLPFDDETADLAILRQIMNVFGEDVSSDLSSGGPELLEGYAIQSIILHLLKRGYSVCDIGDFDTYSFGHMNAEEALAYLKASFEKWDETHERHFSAERVAALQGRARKLNNRVFSQFPAFSHELRRASRADLLRLLADGYVVHAGTNSNWSVLLLSTTDTLGNEFTCLEVFGLNQDGYVEETDLEFLERFISYPAGLTAFRR